MTWLVFQGIDSTERAVVPARQAQVVASEPVVFRLGEIQYPFPQEPELGVATAKVVVEGTGQAVICFAHQVRIFDDRAEAEAYAYRDVRAQIPSREPIFTELGPWNGQYLPYETLPVSWEGDLPSASDGEGV